MRSYKIYITLASALMLSACMSQKPAPYVDKSTHVYTKDGAKQHGNNTQKTAALPSNPDYSDSEISEKKLDSIEVVETKQIEQHEAVIKKESVVQERKESNLTDMELESQIDKKSTQDNQSVAKQAGPAGALKLASPIDNPKYQWPVEGEVLARYGKTGNKFNEGVNIASPLGAPVVAASDGKVVYIGKNVEGYGNLIIIKHENDIMTAYAHMSEVVVERGAVVKKGESVGAVGKEGSVDQPQLHFSVRKGKKTVNPELPLK